MLKDGSNQKREYEYSNKHELLDKNKKSKCDNEESQLSSKFATSRETDNKKIEARLKQIKFGKNTIGYDNYRAFVPLISRKGTHEHPRTPDPYELQSKRAFDGRIKIWRRELHKWDNISNVTASASELLTTTNTLDNLVSKCNSGNPPLCDPCVSVDKSFEAYMLSRNKTNSNTNDEHDEYVVSENDDDDDSDIL